MNPRDFPLQQLLDLAHTRADDAARKLGQLLACEHSAGEKLTLLEQYRDEYRARFISAAESGIGRQEWANYQIFLGRLEDAIAQQRSVVSQAKHLTAAGQRDWLSQRNRVRAFDTLSQRHQAQHQRAIRRQEQKSLDEHSATRYRSARATD